MKNAKLIWIFLAWSANGFAQIRIDLDPSSCKLPSLAQEDGTIPSPGAVARDAFCAGLLLRKEAPQGAIALFGSARLGENHPYYKMTRRFAYLWTKAHGQYPLLTGGGKGLMEAANRGAYEAGGKSLGIQTNFSQGAENPNLFLTAAYVAASFSQREADLIDYAYAIVVAPGGFGTEWELFESLSKIQTRKKAATPIVLLGDKAHWASLLKRLQVLATAGTISAQDLNLVQVASTPEEAVRLINAFRRNP